MRGDIDQRDDDTPALNAVNGYYEGAAEKTHRHFGTPAELLMVSFSFFHILISDYGTLYVVYVVLVTFGQNTPADESSGTGRKRYGWPFSRPERMYDS